uniref:LD16029p n=1 Tax=Drosophila melanogaster TaxID=7227 RepID=Q8MQK0_DROME|nr:LD16029p [Drosophila melanogaster]
MRVFPWSVDKSEQTASCCPPPDHRMMDSACVWSSRRTAEAVNRSRSAFAPFPPFFFCFFFFFVLRDFFRGGEAHKFQHLGLPRPLVRLRFIWLPFDLHTCLLKGRFFLTICQNHSGKS